MRLQGATSLEDAGTEALPGWPGLHLLALAVNQVPVKLTAARIDVHLGGSEPSLALPEISGDPESSDDEDGQVGLEEVVGGSEPGTNGGDGSVEL